MASSLADDSAGRMLSDQERLDWLRLIRSENIGPIRFFQLLEHCGSATAALAELPDLVKRAGGRRGVKITPVEAAEREIEAHARLGAQLFAHGEPAYPAALAAISDPPPLISVLGDPDWLVRSTVAIVGSRNASANGCRMAEAIAAALGAEGLVVASGMARGIDTSAHHGALAAGTVAVLAGGVDEIYPPENADLYRAIIENGAVIAEPPPGTTAKARDFPRRNRVIAGLAHGVVVIEAALKSGALITARLALEEGREVFAVPGSPLDPRCRGSNRLIRDGATLTESGLDVITGLAGILAATPKPPPTRKRRPIKRVAPRPHGPKSADSRGGNMASTTKKVLEMLSPTPVTVDELVRRCQLSPAVISMVLLELELAGRLERHPGHRVSLL